MAAVVNVWLAWSLVEVNDNEPSVLMAAVKPMPSVDSAALRSASVLTEPAAGAKRDGLRGTTAGVKISVLVASEFAVPAALVRSPAVPASAGAAAATVAEAFVVKPVGA